MVGECRVVLQGGLHQKGPAQRPQSLRRGIPDRMRGVVVSVLHVDGHLSDPEATLGSSRRLPLILGPCWSSVTL